MVKTRVGSNPGPLHQMIGGVGGELHLSVVQLIIKGGIIDGSTMQWLDKVITRLNHLRQRRERNVHEEEISQILPVLPCRHLVKEHLIGDRSATSPQSDVIRSELDDLSCNKQ